MRAPDAPADSQDSEELAQLRPDVVEHARLRRRHGMDAVGLEHVGRVRAIAVSQMSGGYIRSGAHALSEQIRDIMP